jgi:uncharacterized protein YjiS (DUF1127 family)
MLCIGSQSFLYAWIRPILAVPPKGAADMFSLHSILENLREMALCCTGSPDSRLRQLSALRKLDAHLLKDIGITPEEAQRGVSWWIAAREEHARPAARLDMRRPHPSR